MTEELTVLLVEDDLGDQVLISALLENDGGTRFLVRAVDRLSGARDALRLGDVDIVLLDLSLPDAQGLESFHALQSICGTVPIVVLTGLVDQDIALQCVTLGAQDYLVKGTVDSDALARSIRYAVQRNRHLHQLALVDELTGVANRRGFSSVGELQWELARSSRSALSVVVVDLDRMKTINDSHGHAAGDSALIETARILSGAVRETDVVARVGGDEFYVLLIGSQDAELVAERIRGAVAERNATGGHDFVLELSLGVATLEHGCPSTLTQLLDAADRAMYTEKTRRWSTPSR